MMENLDLRCAELGRQLAEQDGVEETVFTEALSVLEEQGVYAFFLSLQARGRQSHRTISNACAGFLRGMPTGAPLLGAGDMWQALQRLSEDLDRLLFARDLLRQALVYGRYHAKARQPAGGGSL